MMLAAAHSVFRWGFCRMWVWKDARESGLSLLIRLMERDWELATDQADEEIRRRKARRKRGRRLLCHLADDGSEVGWAVELHRSQAFVISFQDSLNTHTVSILAVRILQQGGNRLHMRYRVLIYKDIITNKFRRKTVMEGINSRGACCWRKIITVSAMWWWDVAWHKAE